MPAYPHQESRSQETSRPPFVTLDLPASAALSTLLGVPESPVSDSRKSQRAGISLALHVLSLDSSSRL